MSVVSNVQLFSTIVNVIGQFQCALV